MDFIDLRREIFHRTQTDPNHPPVITTVWNGHSDKRVAGSTVVSSKALSIAISDHHGTHVDAPVHYDPRPGAASIDEVPLENFDTAAICLDPSHVPHKHPMTVPEMQTEPENWGREIRHRDTVAICMATSDRLLGKPGYRHDFPGLSLESVRWLADRGILMAGVEAISPAVKGGPNFLAHMSCAGRGITHLQCLTSPDKLVGRVRFRFVGFPTKTRRGTASPIRAVVIFERLKPNVPTRAATARL